MTRKKTRSKTGGRRVGAGRKPTEGVKRSLMIRVSVTPDVMAECTRIAGYIGEKVHDWVRGLIDREVVRANARNVGWRIADSAARFPTPSLPTDED